jgi:hypothetical protein
MRRDGVLVVLRCAATGCWWCWAAPQGVLGAESQWSGFPGGWAFRRAGRWAPGGRAFGCWVVGGSWAAGAHAVPADLTDASLVLAAVTSQP